MCEWRSGFASAALTILHALFEDNDINTDEERQAFAEDALNGYSFIYRDVGENQGVVCYISSSLLQVLCNLYSRRSAKACLAARLLFARLRLITAPSVVPHMYQASGTRLDLLSHLRFLRLEYFPCHIPSDNILIKVFTGRTCFNALGQRIHFL